MGKAKLREKGDQYRPVVKVLKAKNGTPTKVYINGQEYALVHQNYINGGKNKVRK